MKLKKSARPRVVYVRTETKGLGPLMSNLVAACQLKTEGWYLKNEVVRVGRCHLNLLLVLLNAEGRKVEYVAGTLKALARKSYK